MQIRWILLEFTWDFEVGSCVRAQHRARDHPERSSHISSTLPILLLRSSTAVPLLQFEFFLYYLFLNSVRIGHTSPLSKATFFLTLVASLLSAFLSLSRILPSKLRSTLQVVLSLNGRIEENPSIHSLRPWRRLVRDQSWLKKDKASVKSPWRITMLKSSTTATIKMGAECCNCAYSGGHHWR